jgi:hypothetical protein
VTRRRGAKRGTGVSFGVCRKTPRTRAGNRPLSREFWRHTSVPVGVIPGLPSLAIFINYCASAWRAVWFCRRRSRRCAGCGDCGETGSNALRLSPSIPAGAWATRPPIPAGVSFLCHRFLARRRSALALAGVQPLAAADAHLRRSLLSPDADVVSALLVVRRMSQKHPVKPE